MAVGPITSRLSVNYKCLLSTSCHPKLKSYFTRPNKIALTLLSKRETVTLLSNESIYQINAFIAAYRGLMYASTKQDCLHEKILQEHCVLLFRKRILLEIQRSRLKTMNLGSMPFVMIGFLLKEILKVPFYSVRES